jgi:putative ABC transport system permease protein
MRSVRLMALSNLRRRKGQGLLVGAIIGLSVLLFFTGVGVMREIDTPVATMLEQQRASHYTLMFDARIHEPDSVRAWFAGRTEVEAVTETMAVIELRESAFFRGRQLSRFLHVAERPLEPTGQDALRIVDGAAEAAPRPGQLWIPTSLAQEMGIHAGDTLDIPSADGLEAMVVGAVVVDPQYSALFQNPTRVWVAPGELPAHFQATRLSRVMIGVRLAEVAKAEPIWDDFVRAEGGVFSGSVLKPREMLDGYTAPYNLMAAMIVAFSALGLLVALFAIQGTVTSAILADFKTIGILRAQGFRPADVRRVYEIQYLVLAGIAAPIGVLIGIVAVKQTIGLLTRSIATPVGTGPLLLQGVVTLLLFLGLIYLFVVRVARGAARVRPADAIRYGGVAGEGTPTGGIALRRLAKFSVPMIVAIKNLALQKRRVVFLAVSVLFATVAAVMAINLDHSFGRMTTDLARFGFDAADVRVSRVGRRFSLRHEHLMNSLRTREGVVGVATWDGVDGTFRADDTRSTVIVPGTVVDGDMVALEYDNLRGRNPAGPREISLAIRTAKDLDRDVGDRVDVHLMGATITFDVVGVYQTINNTGRGFRIRLEAVRLASPLWSPTEYGVALADGVDPEQFNAALEAEYGEAVDAKAGDFFIRDQLASIMSGMRMANGFLAAVFLLAAAVFIFNTTLLTIGENRRVFGILKTAGMTPVQLRGSVVAGVGVQALLGISAGLALWWLAAPAVLSGLFGTVGLVSFPLTNSVVGMAVAVPLIFGFCLLSAWIPSSRVLDINPRSLIVE